VVIGAVAFLHEGHIMQLTEVRVKLCDGPAGRLKAFCSLTFDHAFVVRDVKLIDGTAGLFLAMPARKLADHCPRCSEKNHLRARYCSNCGLRLDENRHLRYQPAGRARLKLHADIAHPIHADCRQEIEQRVIDAYREEVIRSKQPGYVPPSLDGEDDETYDVGCDVGDGYKGRLRPTGLAH
jgi:stage V sporulation protein G